MSGFTKAPIDAKSIRAVQAQLKKPRARLSSLKRPCPTRPGWYYEILPLTLGRARILYTDGAFVDHHW